MYTLVRVVGRVEGTKMSSGTRIEQSTLIAWLKVTELDMFGVKYVLGITVVAIRLTE
jgi:hypothetical protein